MPSSCKGCSSDCLACNKVEFPAPPVCTAQWNNGDWGQYIKLHGRDREPKTLTTQFDTWVKTNKTNEQGEALYTRMEI